VSRLPARREETRIARRRLCRDSKNGKVAGVCEGLGVYLGIDPVWLRVVWAVAIFVYGVGLVPYLIAWVAMPDRPEPPPPPPEPDTVPPELIEAWKEVNEITRN
jgi:phage shock protein PspC (stress-responsive transcriptional regulator)